LEPTYNTKERESIFAIKGEKRGDASLCGELAAKRIYSAVKITTNLTSSFYSKKEWKKENSARLLSCESVDNKK